jgi:hypothetical protein
LTAISSSSTLRSPEIIALLPEYGFQNPMKKIPLIVFSSALLASLPSKTLGEDKASPADNAQRIVSRYEGVWTAPPKKVPSNALSDAPLLGNGDLGVLIGGPPEKQQFFLSKNDFWRPQPYFPWFTPALSGVIDLEIPALQGAGYRVVQDISKAEVRQTFTKAEGTVEMRSWTPATGHELIVEISCTGKPVEIKASPWTYFGNGATVETGQEGEATWLTRSFTGPGYDWDSRATMAVSLEGSSVGTPTPVQSAAKIQVLQKQPVLLGGRQLVDKVKQQYTKPFQGQIHALDLYDRVLSEEEIAKLQKDGVVEGKPIFTTRQGDSSGVEFSEGKIDGVSFGEISYAPKSFTMILDITPESRDGQILQIGEPSGGVLITQLQKRSGYNLRVRAGRTVGSLDNLVLKDRIVAVITSDERTLLLRLRGKTSGTRRIDAAPRILTLQPGKPMRLVAAVRTNQEKPDFQAAAIQDVTSLNDNAVTKLRDEHRQWWGTSGMNRRWRSAIRCWRATITDPSTSWPAAAGTRISPRRSGELVFGRYPPVWWRLPHELQPPSAVVGMLHS